MEIDIKLGKYKKYNDRYTDRLIGKYPLVIYSLFFFMGRNLFVHLTHLKLPQISKTSLKFFV